MFTLRRLVLSLILAAAVVTLAVGFSMHTDNDDEVAVSDAAVEAVIPASGDLDLRQARIGVDLAPGYTGILQVDGVEIPEDQLERVEALNQVFFTPREGTETGQLFPGRHQATAVFWPAGQTREAASRSVNWTFSVH